jgi:glycosyltransferase involved in cell wall biosynthesis
MFIWAFYHYNVFLFGFGLSFFPLHLDLPILKFFDKKIIFTFFGSDERPPYINGTLLNRNPELEDYKKKSQEIKSNIVSIEKYADHIITLPASAHFHQKKSIDWLLIGIPIALLSHNDSGQTKTKSIRILHSPSNPTAKGSTQIRSAIAELRQKGYCIDFVEITKRPHCDVINALQECDFVVDQVYSDSPMAVFAAEAAWFGKPAVLGGYYADYVHNDYAPEDIPPSLYCHPDEITSSIERLIIDKEYRQELGRQACNFVKTKWTSEQVAFRYLQIIEDTIPKKFIFNPNYIQYVQGGGMSESRNKDVIRRMIEKYGIGSLCLSDKPKLEQRFIEYAFNL